MSNNQQTDWVSTSKHFARIPLEILSADLTLNELKLFIALASFAQRDGSLGDFTRCQKTLGEVIGWIDNATQEGDKNRVYEALKKLKAKKLVTAEKRPGINAGLDYKLYLPPELELRPTINRKSPEYLALAAKKRQAVKDVYKAKTEKELDRRMAGFEYYAGVGVSDELEMPEIPDTHSNSISDDNEEIPNSVSALHGFDDAMSEWYEGEFTETLADIPSLLADSIISKNFEGMADEDFKKQLLDVIARRYPDFIELETHQKQEAFVKQFRILNR